MAKKYSELIKFKTFKERFEYLSINGQVGSETFGYDRYLNQLLYRSYEWRRFRDRVIERDNGNDLACENYEIPGSIYIHHLNPITAKDIVDRDPKLFDLDNVVCCSFDTHQAIHYSDPNLLVCDPITRYKNDTCPWKHEEDKQNG